MRTTAAAKIISLASPCPSRCGRDSGQGCGIDFDDRFLVRAVATHIEENSPEAYKDRGDGVTQASNWKPSVGGVDRAWRPVSRRIRNDVVVDAPCFAASRSFHAPGSNSGTEHRAIAHGVLARLAEAGKLAADTSYAGRDQLRRSLREGCAARSSSITRVFVKRVFRRRSAIILHLGGWRATPMTSVFALDQPLFVRHEADKCSEEEHPVSGPDPRHEGKDVSLYDSLRVIGGHTGEVEIQILVSAGGGWRLQKSLGWRIAV